MAHPPATPMCCVPRGAPSASSHGAPRERPQKASMDARQGDQLASAEIRLDEIELDWPLLRRHPSKLGRHELRLGPDVLDFPSVDLEALEGMRAAGLHQAVERRGVELVAADIKERRSAKGRCPLGRVGLSYLSNRTRRDQAIDSDIVPLDPSAAIAWWPSPHSLAVACQEAQYMAALPLVHLSDVVKRPLVDGNGDRLGKTKDLVARMGERPHPPVVGAVARIAGRDLFVPIHQLSGLGEEQVRFDGNRVDLRHFERRPGELLLTGDLLRRHLINVVGGRLIRAHEIELANTGGTWQVVGVDPSARMALGRRLPWARRRQQTIVDCASIEPFVAHVPTARLHIPYRKLARLRPAQIADMVEAASHEEGEEIIEAVGADQELEADVFEELDPGHQVEFIESRSDADAARVMARMAPDDAADLIMEIDQERRKPILDLLPQPQQQKVRSLLTYNPETAGGLMSPDFLSLPEDTPVAAVLDAIRTSKVSPEALNWVFAAGEQGQLTGAASVVSLVRADPSATLGSVAQPDPVHVHPDWDLGATLRKMSDYNLTVVPVLGEERHELLGVVTVDDLLELLLPSGWRRDYGVTAPEDEEHVG